MAAYWGPAHDHSGIGTTAESGFGANQLLRWPVLRLFAQTKDVPPCFVAETLASMAAGTVPYLLIVKPFGV